jgi:protocatechuate 3,4-dioxygenase beta subunit
MRNRREILIVVAVVLVAALGAVLAFMQRGRDSPSDAARRTARGSAAQTTVAGPGKTGDETKPARVTVVVRGAQGPLAGATVRLSADGGDVSILTTTADGSITSDPLEPGTWTISASAAGHEPASVEPRELKPGETARIEVTLVAGGRLLTGQVTDASGGPIAGARIDAAKLGAMVRATSAVASTLTGADGKYSLTVAEGQLLVAASEASYAPQSRYVEVGANGAVASFALVPGGVIEGIVRDESTREAIAGAVVTARRDTPAMQLGERSRQQAVAGKDGRFRIAGLRPGAYELAGAAGARVSRAPTIVGLGVAEQVTDIEILVSRAATVRGVVLDENSTPAAGVHVTLFGRGGRGGEIEATSDAKGAFVLEGIGAGRYMLAGSSDDYVAVGATRLEVAAQDVDGVKVNVRRGAKIVGHVEPRQVCEIRVEDDDDGGNPMHAIAMLAPTTTGADGNFEMKPVDLSKYAVLAKCASGAQGSKKIAVAAGTNEVVVAVKAGGSIAGTVVDRKGKPVAGITVMATPGGDVERTTIVNGMITSGEQTLTNAQGMFELRGLAAGPYQLGALDRGRPVPTDGDKAVTLGEAEKKTGVKLSVDRADGVIRGVVTGPDGKPLADAWVSLHVGIDDLVEARMDRERRGSSRIVRVENNDEGASSAGDIAPVLTNASGAFEITGLARLPYTVLAEAQSGALRGQQLRVTPDASITIQALGVTELRGTVKASAPLTWFTVELEGPTREQRTFATPDGTFSFGRVDPGKYTVSVTSSAGNGEAKVVVEPGKPASVEIALAANAIVTGKLVDAAGKPIGGIPVVVIPDQGEGRMQVRIEGPPTTSGPDGAFKIEAKAGPSIVVAMTPPSPTTKKGLKLEAGKTVDIGALTVSAPAPP